MSHGVAIVLPSPIRAAVTNDSDGQIPLETGRMEKTTLTGVPETLLAALYGRALDSRQSHSILHDHAADQAVRRIAYDFERVGMTTEIASGVAVRGKLLDRWTTEFLAECPRATVLHLACGLDTRVQRIGPSDEVRWIDLDLPDVIALRHRLLVAPGGDYRTVGASVASADWLADVPADRPTVAVFEGLAMYLHKDEGKDLISRVVTRFPSGQLLFDICGRDDVKAQDTVAAIRNAGATVRWGLDDPSEIEALHPGLTCLDAVHSRDVPELDLLPLTGRILRYRF
jgi:O-methyltransferase involved in polyketide biosynthesis